MRAFQPFSRLCCRFKLPFSLPTLPWLRETESRLKFWLFGLRGCVLDVYTHFGEMKKMRVLIWILVVSLAGLSAEACQTCVDPNDPPPPPPPPPPVAVNECPPPPSSSSTSSPPPPSLSPSSPLLPSSPPPPSSGKLPGPPISYIFPPPPPTVAAEDPPSPPSMSATTTPSPPPTSKYPFYPYYYLYTNVASSPLIVQQSCFSLFVLVGIMYLLL